LLPKEYTYFAGFEFVAINKLSGMRFRLDEKLRNSDLTLANGGCVSMSQ